MSAAIEVAALSKNYGPIQAVRGVTFEVRQGEIFALLGPNGAGKTTIAEMLEGYRQATSGSAMVLGADPWENDPAHKGRLGIVMQSTGVDPFLTVRETIEMYSGFYPHPRPSDEVLELVDLSAKAGEKVRRLSGGQQRRLDVGVALAGDPELLFLDEPTSGFDPSARRNFWDMIKALASLDTTVFLTTHNMDEAQYLADRVGIINEGVIVAEGDPETIGARDTAETSIQFRLGAGAPPLPATFGAATFAEGTVVLSSADPTRVLNDLTGWALDAGVSLDGLSVSRPSLEDVYLKLTEEQDP
jgi:ABC-2 type transport system ATP-binding protein